MACYDSFIADISIAPYTYAPYSFAFCDGSLLNIAQNQALFALIYSTYGGNGTTNFKLPDLRGRIPLGADNNLYRLGATGGAASVTPATVQTEKPEGESPTIQAAAPGALQILPPYQALNYIIALQGIWPSRW